MKNDAFGRTPDEMEDEARHREPRCRICRDESVRVLVNELLDWHGAPIILGRGKTHLVTYADILRDFQSRPPFLTQGQRSRTETTSEAADAAPPPGPLCAPSSGPRRYGRMNAMGVSLLCWSFVSAVAINIFA